ncbi:farnesyltransferase subunit beta, putative [Theileria equi strain WA]|uniref:Protein farnesyltransferase subunit beta n=1 Tax=Theileria equi strain WA TaxID=1537102 RepID=L0AY61_THEEQ|nr:farnesyltransferase subunit beta, putative [Theileria equi strain WA]AFZ79936.1 farnesyltransferase subunit beta, putative [Theileria equi strain WA]|eukprot:XP_004829602.1 farnesyltransferase subunit beta, putative [Theileria equi strain WA]
MDNVKEIVIKRIEDAVSSLNKLGVFVGCEISTLKLGDDGFVDIPNGDDVFDYVAVVLAKYVISLCKNVDFLEEDDVSQELEESIESQKLVESDCLEVLSQVISDAMKRKNINFPSYQYHDVSIDIDSTFFAVRPYMFAVNFLSDHSVSGRGDKIKINFMEHGHLIIRKLAEISLDIAPLMRESHISYISGYLSSHGTPKKLRLEHLSCSRPWVIYWALHSLLILGADIKVYRQRAINTIMSCWDEVDGGFGGGPDQKGHLATTYAALCCLKMLDSLDECDRDKMYNFLLLLKNENGSFRMHIGGEIDTRSIYCAVSSASILEILTPKLVENTAEYISKCQTYEGGIASEPNLEAHAGYTYCGLAALALLGNMDIIDTKMAYRWCINRVTPQFGFQGRPHKLVDSCYSFWVGASLEILNLHMLECNEADSRKLEQLEIVKLLLAIYIMTVSQTGKGFRDKPRKTPDLYHTCYALSYLNIIKGYINVDDAKPINSYVKHNLLLNLLV